LREHLKKKGGGGRQYDGAKLLIWVLLASPLYYLKNNAKNV